MPHPVESADFVRPEGDPAGDWSCVPGAGGRLLEAEIPNTRMTMTIRMKMKIEVVGFWRRQIPIPGSLGEQNGPPTLEGDFGQSVAGRSMLFLPAWRLFFCPTSACAGLQLVPCIIDEGRLLCEREAPQPYDEADGELEHAGHENVDKRHHHEIPE